MATMTTLRHPSDRDRPSTLERKLAAESHLRRPLTITDSARERVRTTLIDVPIEDSPIKKDWRRRDEEVLFPIRVFGGTDVL